MNHKNNARSFFGKALILILLLITAACAPSEQEKILEGKWIGTAVIDDDGDRMNMKLTLDFNREKDLMKFRMDMSMPGVGDLLTMTMRGDWLADEEEISMFIDESTVNVSFDSGISALAYMMGVQAFSLERQLEAEMKEEIGLWNDLEIISLDHNKLVVDFDETPVTLYKQ